jgi:hypothetical protein
MRIQDMFASAVSLLQNEALIKEIYFPAWDVTVRASIKFRENFGNAERGSKAYNARVLLELKELEGTDVTIKYDTVIELDGATWKVVQQEAKNEVFQSFFIRMDSRISLK